MRKLSYILLALALLLALAPALVPGGTAEAAEPTIIVVPIVGYVNSPPFIGGIASDDEHPIVAVRVQIECVTDGTQWNGIASWVLTQPNWLEASPMDLVGFDELTEGWFYVPPPAYEHGKQYELAVVQAEDLAPEFGVIYPGIVFTYDIEPPVVTVGTVPAKADDLLQITGTAVDSTSPIKNVWVKISRPGPEYLNLEENIWQDCEKWNDATAQNGAFDEQTEIWELDTSGVPWYDGVTYTITATASDSAGNNNVSAVLGQYECDRYLGTATALDVDVNGAEEPYYVDDPQPDIEGSASSVAGKFVAEVLVKLERDVDGAWWNGTPTDAWELGGGARFNDATAINAPFGDSNIEDWQYNTGAVVWNEGLWYTVTGKVRDSDLIFDNTDTEHFCIDLTNPNTGLMALTDGMSAPFVITGTATDNAPGQVYSVQVMIHRLGDITGNDYWNGLVWQNDPIWLDATVSGSSPSYSWSLSVGAILHTGERYTVSAKAVDGAGNCDENLAGSQSTFRCGAVVPPPPTPPTPSPTASATTPPVTHPSPSPTATVVPAVPTPSPTPSPSATPTPEVRIDAPTVVLPEASFTARVRISDVDDFGAASYQIEYDPDVIELTDVDDGQMGGTAVPVMNWAFVPVDEQGVVLIANDLAGNLSLAGSGILAELKFDVVGELGDTSDIDFILPQCKLYDSGTPSGSQVDAGWVDDSVRVGGEATPTPTTTSNATATPTATATGGDEDSGSPGWLWPVIGIMIFLTLVFGGLALYKGGVLAKLGATWGATEEDFLVDDMSDEDLYDAMYGGEEEEEL